MTDLVAQFEDAIERSKKLRRRPDNDTLLQMYAFFKQAKDGDVAGDKPGFTDFKGRAKYAAWEELKGTSPDMAMHQYIEIIEELEEI